MENHYSCIHFFFFFKNLVCVTWASYVIFLRMRKYYVSPIIFTLCSFFRTSNIGWSKRCTRILQLGWHILNTLILLLKWHSYIQNVQQGLWKENDSPKCSTRFVKRKWFIKFVNIVFVQKVLKQNDRENQLRD